MNRISFVPLCPVMFISHKVRAIFFLSVSDIYSYPNSLDDSYSITIMSSTVILAYQGNYRNERVKKSASSDSSTDEKDVINADGFDVQESDDSVIQHMKTVMIMEDEDGNNQKSTKKNDKTAIIEYRRLVNELLNNLYTNHQDSISTQSLRLPEQQSPGSPPTDSPSSNQNEENSDYLWNLTGVTINERLTIRVISPDGTLLHEITRSNNE